MNTVIGLTGPTGAGKSMLAPVAEAFGFSVIDCDRVARVAVKKDTPGLAALVSAFGADILSSDGELNRAVLAKKAFADPEHTALLNETILPFIVTLIEDAIRNKNALLDAPTLFESGIDRICTATVAVLADKTVRLSRITERDRLTQEDALLRLNAGKPDPFYREKADYILYNNGSPEELNRQFSEILTEITGGQQHDRI